MPFNRLLKEVDRLRGDQVFGERELVVQSGSSTHVCRNCRQFAFCTAAEFATLVRRADLVISHGGIGTLLPALRLGRRVIAIPRLRRYGEHHSDHQVQICTELDRQKALFTSPDIADLALLVGRDPSDLRPFDPPSTIVADVRADLLAFDARLGARKGRWA